MRGTLSNLYRVKLVSLSESASDGVFGRLGVFDYDGAGEGSVCLFVPDDPEALGGRVKVRCGPGTAQVDDGLLRLTMKDGSGSRAWKLCDVIADPAEKQAFLNFAEANDRIIRHLLEGARLLEG